MKNGFLILLIIAVVVVVLSSFLSLASSKIEKQRYRVVKKERAFEIRYYPPAVFATVRSSATSYKELANSGFRKIAGYIFGNNQASAKIAMTAPVHMDIDDRNSSMSFVMPSAYDLKNLPRPNDARIELHESAGEYAAAIEFSGYASDEKIKKYASQLKKLLMQRGIRPVGHFRYLGYNPPYQFVGRKNEVIVEVEWKEP